MKRKAFRITASLFLAAAVLFIGTGVGGVNPPTNPEMGADYNSNVYDVGNKEVKVHFININKIKGTSINDVADCTLIQDSGINILIDSGTVNADAGVYVDYESESIPYEINYLKKAGVEKLDYVINTHVHEDHIGGLMTMIKEFTVTKAVIAHELDWTKIHPTQVNAERNFFELKDVTERQITPDGKQMQITEPIEGREGRIALTKDSYLEFYLLPKSEQNANEELNHTSLIVYYVYKDFKALVTGDSDSRLNSHLASGGVGHVQVFQAQHHTATGINGTYNSEGLLNLITPDICVIPAHRLTEQWPFDNDTTYGNFKRLKEHKITTYSTGLNGDVLISSDGSLKNFTVKCTYSDTPLISGDWKG